MEGGFTSSSCVYIHWILFVIPCVSSLMKTLIAFYPPPSCNSQSIKYTWQKYIFFDGLYPINSTCLRLVRKWQTPRRIWARRITTMSALGRNTVRSRRAEAAAAQEPELRGLSASETLVSYHMCRLLLLCSVSDSVTNTVDYFLKLFTSKVSNTS